MISPLFRKMLNEAENLNQAELERHALVSTANNHTCESCFTCACEQIRQEHEKNDDCSK